MCGIFSYSGPKKANDVILTGLTRLDYRGHDSWGLTVANNHALHTFKTTGKIGPVSGFVKLTLSNVGIGHTRWATHGGVSHINAHPHLASDGSFALVHNGMVENQDELKQKLNQANYRYISQTDTEVIVRLIESKLRLGLKLRQAVRLACKELKGRNTIALITPAGRIIAARQGSPLVVGFSGNRSELFISSDTFSFAPFVKKICVIDNGQLLDYQNKKLKLFVVKNSHPTSLKVETLKTTTHKIDKEGFDHFMIKEIYDTPFALKQVINQKKKQIDMLSKAIKKAKNVYVIGSGSSGIAAAQIAYYLRTIGGIGALSVIGAEAQSYFHLFSSQDLIFAPSQSGETADVLEVLEIAKKHGAKIASYVNMAGSMMTRMSDYPFMINAGPEICVMATKVFTSKMAFGYLLAKSVSGKYTEGVRHLNQAIQAVEKYLKNQQNHQAIKQLAGKIASKKDIFLLGKSENLAVVMEGMVKLVEGAYKHAHALPAGDLKHYAITIIEKGIPVIAVVSEDQAKNDMLSAISQVRARGATVIGIAPEKNPLFDYYLSVPKLVEATSLANIIPLQLLAYYLTVELKNDVDQPRNIAKSVTVK